MDDAIQVSTVDAFQVGDQPTNQSASAGQDQPHSSRARPLIAVCLSDAWCRWYVPWWWLVGQGAEREVVVLSCTRTRALGFLDSPHRYHPHPSLPPLPLLLWPTPCCLVCLWPSG